MRKGADFWLFFFFSFGGLVVKISSVPGMFSLRCLLLDVQMKLSSRYLKNKYGIQEKNLVWRNQFGSFFIVWLLPRTDEEST